MDIVRCFFIGSFFLEGCAETEFMWSTRFVTEKSSKEMSHSFENSHLFQYRWTFRHSNSCIRVLNHTLFDILHFRNPVLFIYVMAKGQIFYSIFLCTEFKTLFGFSPF
jgi:hypothetical protein